MKFIPFNNRPHIIATNQKRLKMANIYMNNNRKIYHK